MVLTESTFPICVGPQTNMFQSLKVMQTTAMIWSLASPRKIKKTFSVFAYMQGFFFLPCNLFVSTINNCWAKKVYTSMFSLFVAPSPAASLCQKIITIIRKTSISYISSCVPPFHFFHCQFHCNLEAACLFDTQTPCGNLKNSLVCLSG